MPHLLLRQLESLGLSADQPPDAAQWRALLERVDDTYHEVSLRSESSVEVAERAESSRRLSEERYRLLFDESPLPIFLICPESLQFLAVNDAVVELYGYTRAEMLAMSVPALKVRDNDPQVAHSVANATAVYEARRASGRAERPWRGTSKHRKKDGTVFDIDLTVHPVSADGRVATMAIGIEVTETRRLEEQLRQAQKMDAVGQLAGGVAHDFNNMLATVLSYADLSLLALGPDHPVAADLAQIIAAAQRGAALTRQLLAFSRQTPVQPKVLSLNSAVAYLEPMLRRLIGETITVSAVLAEDLGAIKADPGHIDQVLLNLAVNARDAMGHGGKLTIETRNTVLDEAAARQVGMSPGSYVVLSVRDSGCGMDAATQLRIFEPFFTTKEVGKGTGLGLSTVFGIVKQSGGHVTVQSEPGRGATFEIVLPRVDPMPRSIPAAAPGPERGAATVLLVEDDEPVRKAVRRLLAGRGYVVLVAPGPREALDILRSQGDGVQLLVTDVVMPEMDGRTLATQVRERHPHIKVLFMSGYTEHVAVKGAALGPGDHFIQKPFTFQQIVGAVKRALIGGESSRAA